MEANATDAACTFAFRPAATIVSTLARARRAHLIPGLGPDKQ